MQIQYSSAVAAGNGSNPKAPPPVSNLLRQYIMCALRVQEGVDDLQEDSTNKVIVFCIRTHCNTMLSVYDEMSDEEREVVDGSHIPTYTARVLLHHANMYLNETDETLLQSMAVSLSFILYTNNAIQTPCVLH